LFAAVKICKMRKNIEKCQDLLPDDFLSAQQINETGATIPQAFTRQLPLHKGAFITPQHLP
jgi:hypothetical protein